MGVIMTTGSGTPTGQIPVSQASLHTQKTTIGGPAAPASVGAGVAPGNKPVPAATAAAAPAPSEEPKRKRKPKESKLVPHPATGSTDRAVYPFEKEPDDFDNTVHKMLVVGDFKSRAAYFEFRGRLSDKQAQEWRLKASEERERRKSGTLSTLDRAKALIKALLATGTPINEIFNGIEGVDLDGLIAEAKAEVDAEATKS